MYIDYFTMNDPIMGEIVIRHYITEIKTYGKRDRFK